ncbi:hypothetical protein ACHAXT_004072 [Thalassiosira profunda]
MSVYYSQCSQVNVSPLSAHEDDAELGGDLDLLPLPEPTTSQREAVGDFITSPSEDRWHQLVESMRAEEELMMALRSIEINGAAPREALPEGTASIMDEFVKTHSPQKWNELVEVMRQEQEEETIDFMESSGVDPARLRIDAENTRDALNIVDSILRPGERLDPPASEHDEDMLGWSLGHQRAREEASRQLDAMLGNSSKSYEEADDDEESTYPSTCSSSSCNNSFEKMGRRPVSSKFVFLASFLVGVVAVIGISFLIGGRPREEVRNVFRGRGKSDSNTLFPFQDGGVDGRLQEEFCGECPWKEAAFTCEARVQWEVREYKVTAEEAMRDNLEYCKRTEVVASSP